MTLILQKGRDGEVYNIGGHNEKTNLEVVRTLLKALNKPEGLIKYVTDRPGHDLRYAIDPAKIEQELGWRPEYDFETGIRDTVAWYLEQRTWMEDIIKGSYQTNYETMYAVDWFIVQMRG